MPAGACNGAELRADAVVMSLGAGSAAENLMANMFGVELHSALPADFASSGLRLFGRDHLPISSPTTF
jgi:hypothetical protein